MSTLKEIQRDHSRSLDILIKLMVNRTTADLYVDSLAPWDGGDPTSNIILESVK